MTRNALSTLFAAALLAGCATTTYEPRKADVPAVLPSGVEQARITDGTIRRDLDFIEGLQGRIKALNDRGIAVESYDLARAQCWLSFGLEEYHENDRTGVIEAALTESRNIVAALESGAPAPATQSPIATSVKLRPDLWAKLDALRASPGQACASAQTACLEVVLNHAGHEFNETGWRHARGTIAKAEQLAAEGDARAAACRIDSDGDGVYDDADRCPGTPPGTPVDATGCPLPPVDGDDDRDGVPNSKDRCPNTPPPARVDAWGCEFTTELRLPGVNFETASATLLEESFAVLDGAVATLRRYPELRIEVAGHTDSRGADAYNRELSQRRAEAVRAWLVERGVGNALTARGYGESQPIASNATDAGRRDNRRVTLRVIP
jgi:outer membrane protein OmpA-like peptidoglycan-associated protein